MTTVANICDRWGMSLPEHEPGTDDWFLGWALRSPKEAGIHLTAGWHAYSSLLGVYRPKDIRSAREYFGGIGAQSLMIQGMFDPAEHVVMDYAREAVVHLAHQLPGVTIRQADAYRPENTRAADLVGLDFGDLTVWKTREGEPHADLLDRVFGLEPKAVVLTDVACRYLHLHRARYESLLGPGTCTSYETYLDALVARLRRFYGYELVAGFSHRWSTVMALVPVGLAPPGVFVPTPALPVGLELL